MKTAEQIVAELAGVADGQPAMGDAEAAGHLHRLGADAAALVAWNGKLDACRKVLAETRAAECDGIVIDWPKLLAEAGIVLTPALPKPRE